MPRRSLPSRWSRAQKPATLMVIRVLVVANVVVLGCAGLICFVFVSRPAGIVEAAVLWGLAVLLIAVLPQTDSRRGDDAEW